MALAIETVKSIVDVAFIAGPVVPFYLNLLASLPWKSYLNTIWPHIDARLFSGRRPQGDCYEHWTEPYHG